MSLSLRALATNTSGSHSSSTLLAHYRLTRGNVERVGEAEKDLLVRKLVEHYPTQGDDPYQKVRTALAAVGVSLT